MNIILDALEPGARRDLQAVARLYDTTEEKIAVLLIEDAMPEVRQKLASVTLFEHVSNNRFSDLSEGLDNLDDDDEERTVPERCVRTSVKKRVYTVTAAQAAGMLGVSASRLYALAKTGKLAYELRPKRVGTRPIKWFCRVQVDALADERNEPEPDE